MDLVYHAIIVSFTTPAEVELSFCIEVGGWGKTISISVWNIDTSYFAVIKSALSSASAAEDMTNLTTWAMVNMGPFHRGTGYFLAGKIWAPARLRPLD